MGGSGKSFFFIRDEEKQMLDDVLKLINPVSWGSVKAIVIIPQFIILSNPNQQGIIARAPSLVYLEKSTYLD